jgi:hypothetical protein
MATVVRVAECVPPKTFIVDSSLNDEERQEEVNRQLSSPISFYLTVPDDDESKVVLRPQILSGTFRGDMISTIYCYSILIVSTVFEEKAEAGDR